MVYRRLQTTALAVTIVFPALATVVVAMRVYSRIVWSHFGWGKLAEIREVGVILTMSCVDDGFIVTATVGPSKVTERLQTDSNYAIRSSRSRLFTHGGRV